MCGTTGYFPNMAHIDDKYSFCLPKLALLCFLASGAQKALSCLPCTFNACRESWEVAAPHAAASLEPFQAQAVLHKQEPLGKWSQGKSRARSRSKLALGKGARGSQGTSGALEVQEQQARTEPKGPRGALTRGCAQCYRGQEATPGDHPGGRPRSLESFLPPDAGHEGHLRGA